MKRTAAAVREIAAGAPAVRIALTEVAAWPTWWPAVAVLERLEAADGIELVRLQSPSYRSGRPFTAEIVSGSDRVRLREVGHSQDWGIEAEWRWAERVPGRTRVELRLAIRNEFFLVTSRQALRRAAESALERLAARTADRTEAGPTAAVEIFEAGADLWMRYGGRLYRLVEESGRGGPR